jgi:hypothetical protein
MAEAGGECWVAEGIEKDYTQRSVAAWNLLHDLQDSVLYNFITKM